MWDELGVAGQIEQDRVGASSPDRFRGGVEQFIRGGIYYGD